MNITIEKMIPIGVAFENVKNAVLEAAGDEQIPFYKNASLRLGEFYPDELNLTSLYVLKKQIAFQRELRKHLILKYGVDTLKLDRVLHLRNGDKLEAMIPPCVEISEENVHLMPKAGDRNPPMLQTLNVPLLIDGIHRVYLAREEGFPVTCIVSRGTDPTYLHYAYPNAWEEVREYDEVPEEKKHYRRQEKNSFMRPLDALRLLTVKKSEYGR